jgi:hypothetical protein
MNISTRVSKTSAYIQAQSIIQCIEQTAGIIRPDNVSICGNVVIVIL